MNRLKETFAKCRAENRIALIPFLTLGFPSIDETLPLVDAIVEGGADVLELGVPFSDPIADGPTIQLTSQIALGNGMNLKLAIKLLAAIRERHPSLPILFMGYLNPFLKFGWESFCKSAHEQGLDGLIIPDLPPEAAAGERRIANDHGLDLIHFLAPNTDEARRNIVIENSTGFIYCTTVTGVTGSRSALSSELSEFFAETRQLTKLPLCAGFGISTPDHVTEVTQYADGAIFASELLNRIHSAPLGNREGVAREFVRSFKEKTHLRKD